MILLILLTFWALTLGFAWAMARAAADGGNREPTPFEGRATAIQPPR